MHNNLVRYFAAFIAAGFFAGLLLVIAPASHAAPPGRTIDKTSEGYPYAAGELLVTFKPGAGGKKIESSLQNIKARTQKELPEVKSRLISFPEIKNERARAAREKALEKKKQALGQDPAVEAVDYNYVRQPSLTPNDPYFLGAPQYGFIKTGFPKAWDRVRGKTIRLAIVDSGIAAGHPDFVGRIAVQKDFVNNDPIAEDNDGHGTHVAGVAGANTGNRYGVAGGCFACGLIIAKVLGSGGGYDSDIADGIIWSANNGAHVINLSFGGPGSSSVLENSVNFATGKGAVLVAAAGNEDTSIPIYPAAYPNVIAVAATDKYDRRASFSNYGDWVDIAAPGVNIVSTLPGGYGYKSGTSIAAPHVSALAALLRNQGRTASQIRYQMQRTAVDLGAPGRDLYYGYGRINAADAVWK